MPYIKIEDRRRLNRLLEGFEDAIQEPGELTYVITIIIMKYLYERPRNFTVLNEIIGVLDNVKNEFYRRVVAPYEDQKIRENGDVF